MTGTNGNGNGAKIGTDKVKQGLAQMLKGGVIVSFHACSIQADRILCIHVVCLDAAAIPNERWSMRFNLEYIQDMRCVFCCNIQEGTISSLASYKAAIWFGNKWDRDM